MIETSALEQLMQDAADAERQAATWGVQVATLRQRVKELEAEAENDRMRLVACSVVAVSNTAESAARNRDMHPDYRHPAVVDVMAAVDREMALKSERDALAARVKKINAVLRGMLKFTDLEGEPEYAAALEAVSGPAREPVEMLRESESLSVQADLLRRLYARLQHATCAGVEQWPEYKELAAVLK